MRTFIVAYLTLLTMAAAARAADSPTADQRIQNSDGTTTLVGPYVSIGGVKTYFGQESYCEFADTAGDCRNVTLYAPQEIRFDSNGICKFLGFDSADEADTGITAASNEQGLRYALMNSDGHLNGIWQRTADNEQSNLRYFVSYIQAVTCFPKTTAK